MRSDQGFAELDFGSAGAHYAEAVVGSTPIPEDAVVHLNTAAKLTTDRAVDENSVTPIVLRVGAIVAGRGFTLYGWGEGPAQRSPMWPFTETLPTIAGKVAVAWSWQAP